MCSVNKTKTDIVNWACDAEDMRGTDHVKILLRVETVAVGEPGDAEHGVDREESSISMSRCQCGQKSHHNHSVNNVTPVGCHVVARVAHVSACR